jgi:predicted metal-dependent hydrolase
MLVEQCRKTVVEPSFARVPPRYDRPSVRYIARPNAIRVHAMTSRWGSCNHSKGNLNFNLWLINAPIRCIEYVVIHEFAHFIHPDHSPKFHELLDALMPDWRARRKELNDTPAPRQE